MREAQSLKTRAFNTIRKAFTNSVGEALLLEIASGKKPDSFPAKFIPMPHLYQSPAMRAVTRNGINYELDISDLVDWHIYFSIFDEGLEALFNMVGKHDTMLDVGANMGHTMLRAAQLANEGMVIGFEPNEHNYKKCLKNISLNNFKNLRIENLALGESKFQTSIKVRDQHNQGMNRVELDKAGEIQGTSLDEWAAANNQQKVHLIKIDVEGYELKVLKGAAATIAACRPKLFIELDDNNLKHYGDSAKSLLEFLWTFEYKVTDFKEREINLRHLEPNGHTDIIAIPK